MSSNENKSEFLKDVQKKTTRNFINFRFDNISYTVYLNGGFLFIKDSLEYGRATFKTEEYLYIVESKEKEDSKYLALACVLNFDLHYSEGSLSNTEVERIKLETNIPTETEIINILIELSEMEIGSTAQDFFNLLGSTLEDGTKSNTEEFNYTGKGKYLTISKEDIID